MFAAAFGRFFDVASCVACSGDFIFAADFASAAGALKERHAGSRLCYVLKNKCFVYWGCFCLLR